MCVCVEWVLLRSRINSTTSPASGAGKVSESRGFLDFKLSPCCECEVFFFCSGFSGLVVSMLAFGTRVRGF